MKDKKKKKNLKKKQVEKEGIQRKIPKLYREGDSDWLILLIDIAHPKKKQSSQLKQKYQELSLIMYCITRTTGMFYGKSNSNIYSMPQKRNERTKKENWTDFRIQ